MLRVIWWPYRWLCRLGLHEYTVPLRRGKLGAHYTCEVCGKKKLRREEKKPRRRRG